MKSPYRLSVTQFTEHFREQLEQIAQVPSEHFRKILYSLILDPLAQAAYPAAGNRANVVLLVKNLTHWADAERVSLIQLKLALLSEKRARYRLYREVKKQMAIRPIRMRTALSTSPYKSELLGFAGTKREEKLVEFCTYAHLLYTYRNNLVHEFREPGYGSDWGRDSTDPYYGKSSFGESELIFPVAFLSRMATEAVARLERHLLDNRIAPHAKFKFGSLWR